MPPPALRSALALLAPSFLALSMALSFIGGCASRSLETDWASANRMDTLEGYREFVSYWADEDAGPLGRSQYVQEARDRIASKERLDANWVKLRAGMSMQEVDDLIGLPPALNTDDGLDAFIESASSFAETGAPTNFSYKLCDRPGGSCVVIDNLEDAKKLRAIQKAKANRHRYGRGFELEFGEDEGLVSWRRD
jgi:hypothetical protein